jgi:hypothetical protein
MILQSQPLLVQYSAISSTLIGGANMNEDVKGLWLDGLAELGTNIIHNSKNYCKIRFL